MELKRVWAEVAARLKIDRNGALLTVRDSRDAYTSAFNYIRRHGVRLGIGKGGMRPATLAAMRDFGCAYLQVVGGAAALTARRIAAVENVFLLDKFGPTEAMWQLRLDGLEAIVGMDAHGASLFDAVREASAKRLKDYTK